MSTPNSSLAMYGYAAVTALATLLTSGSALAEHGYTPRAPAAHARSSSKAPVVPPDISPAFTYDKASYAAGGATLRNRASSEINLSSLPTDATVIQAFLYWDFTALTSTTDLQSRLCFGKDQEPSFNSDEDNDDDSKEVGGEAKISPRLKPKHTHLTKSTFPINSDGDADEQPQPNCTVVTGTQIGIGNDACWLPQPDTASNFAFRADVTSLVTGNGRYIVALQPGAASAESGIDPADPTSPVVGPYAEGASLVVIFSSTNIPNGKVLVYDSGIAAHEFISGDGFAYHLTNVPATGPGDSMFTEIGADGQSAFGAFPISTVKVTSINGNDIAGFTNVNNIDTDSDWSGSDGFPSVNLWDTHTHGVKNSLFNFLVTGSNSVNIIDPTSGPGGGDCIVGIANVLEVR